MRAEFVLLLRLTGPGQSWGTQSRFALREAGREPSKSGVIGLLCAALGAPREDLTTVARLAALRFAARVDREGVLRSDFHTVGGGRVPGRKYGVANARDGLGGTVLSTRDYLADADFLVGLAGSDEEIMRQADRALRQPVWPLYLGRRCFPPAVPPPLGLFAGDLQSVLSDYPWMRRRPGEVLPEGGLRLVRETTEPRAEPRWDQPVSFQWGQRDYQVRRVTTLYVHPPVAGGGPCPISQD